MPDIFIYFGLHFFFYPEDHYPVHVHAEYQGMENVYELIFDNGKIVDVVQRRKATKRKKEPLPPAQARDARDFVWAKRDQIYEKWRTYIIEKKKVKCEIITRRVRS